MSGTNSSISKPSSGTSLPVPEVRIQSLPEVQPANILASRSYDGDPLEWVKYPVIVAADIPVALLNPQLELRLELLRYVGSGQKRDAGLKVSQPAGYKHPADFRNGAGTFTGLDTHCGIPTGISILDRQTVWQITDRNQIIPVDLGGFFKLRSSLYRDLDGTNQVAQILTPSWAPSKGRRQNDIRKRVPYGPRRMPGYFAFRYSVKNLVDGRGFLTGPLSKTLSAYGYNNTFNFNPVEAQRQGRPVVQARPGAQKITVAFGAQQST